MNTDNQLDAVVDKLEKALKDSLAALPTPLTSAAVEWINAPLTTPNNAPWLRSSLVNFGQIDQDASGSYEINQGQYTVAIFFPKKSGSRAALKQAQAIKAIYTGEIFDDLVIESATVSPTSEPASSAWFGVNCVVTYSYEGLTA